MTKKKTWVEKLNEPKQSQTKRIDFSFADIPADSMMFIATPQIIDNHIRQMPSGTRSDIKTLRRDLAAEHHADYTCPITTGIFLRIVAEANYEKMAQGVPQEEITPFWRVIAPDSPLAKKLSFGPEFIKNQLEMEKL